MTAHVRVGVFLFHAPAHMWKTSTIPPCVVWREKCLNIALYRSVHRSARILVRNEPARTIAGYALYVCRV